VTYQRALRYLCGISTFEREAVPPPQLDAISPDEFKDCTTATYFRSIVAI